MTTRFNSAGNAARSDRKQALLAIVPSQFHFFSYA
jgi:hypothetical protein